MDKIDFNKADFEQYLFNENAIIKEFDKLLKTCRSQRRFSAIFPQNAMICWLSGHRPQYRSCIANRTVHYLARTQSSAFGGGGTKPWAGGRLRSRDQTNSECGRDLVNILLQILCYPSLVWILPSNLEVKTKKIKKGLHRKI